MMANRSRLRLAASRALQGWGPCLAGGGARGTPLHRACCFWGTGLGVSPASMAGEQKEPSYPVGAPTYSVGGVPEPGGRAGAPLLYPWVCRMGPKAFSLVPSPTEGAFRVGTGEWEPGRPSPSHVAQPGCFWVPHGVRTSPVASRSVTSSQLSALTGARRDGRCRCGAVRAERRPEQCTNPFILFVCQRLVRAGWSQHDCGAPSRPPPP